MRVRETMYKNIQFRSRLEARWAVFFDELGLSWDYEPEGYRMDDGTCYLPDFYVHGIKGHVGNTPHGDGIFIEVKGEVVESDKRKISRFQYPILMVGDIPKSTNPWIDVDAQYTMHPRYLFSECSVDGTEEALWFAVKDGQVYLMRYGETRSDSSVDLCVRACKEALNKKFEYQQRETSSEGRGRFSTLEDIITSALGGFSSSYGRCDENPEQFKQRLEEEEKRKRERSERTKEAEKILKDSVPKISVEEWLECYKTMPGIPEYNLAERLVNVCSETEIPLESMYMCTFDAERKRKVITYTFSKHEMFGFFESVRYEAKGELVAIELEGQNRDECARECDQLTKPVCDALDWVRREMQYRLSPSVDARTKLDIGEETARKRICLAIEKEKEERAEEEAIIAANNPYRVGDLLAIMREEAFNPENKFELTEVLSGIQLAYGISEDARFGLGMIMVSKRGNDIVLQMNHPYSTRGASGKYYSLNDTRELFYFLSEDTTMKTYFEVSRLRDISLAQIQKKIQNPNT